MLTQLQARRDIYQRFIDLWPPGPPAIPYTFDNEDFTPPAGSSWVRFVVRHDSSLLDAIGGTAGGGFNKYRRTGRVVVQVFTPLNAGVAAADALIDTLRDIFEGAVLGPNAIRFNNVVAREIGPDEAWYQVNVEASFEYNYRRW